jgi:protein SCO1
MSKKVSNKKFAIGITAAFLLPFSLYLVTRALSKDKIPVPRHFIAESVDSSMVDGKMVYDTTFHQTSDLELINQLGDRVSLNKDLKGKVLVVDFIFVDCQTICPQLTGNMKLLQRAFKKNDTGVHLVSITVNPEADTFQRLREYADRYSVNHDRWWFLTGNRKDIYNFARNELHVTMQPGDGGLDDFIHTEKLVLLDQDRYIRGYYNGRDSAEVKRCADDVVKVTMEKKKKKPQTPKGAL